MPDYVSRGVEFKADFKYQQTRNKHMDYGLCCKGNQLMSTVRAGRACFLHAFFLKFCPPSWQYRHPQDYIRACKRLAMEMLLLAYVQAIIASVNRVISLCWETCKTDTALESGRRCLKNGQRSGLGLTMIYIAPSVPTSANVCTAYTLV